MLKDYFDCYDKIVAPKRAILECSYRRQQLSLEQALEQAGKPDLYRRLVERIAIARQQSRMAAAPILGVLGQLNAGKSSLVASFLSPNGRRRIPRGLDDKSGTHRFVYWLPQSWYDSPQLRNDILHVLGEAHGAQPEFLADDPKSAAAQYYSGRSNPERIPIPLVAFDSELSQFGLLDALDIQTEDDPGEYTCNRRLNFVAQAARVCSAFLVVWNKNSVRDRVLRELLDRLRQVMPEAKIYLLINMLRSSSNGEPRSTFNDRDVQEVVKRFKLAGVYVAFDLNIPGWQKYTPSGLIGSPVDMTGARNSASSRSATQGPSEEERLPLFFTVPSHYYDRPQDVPQEYWLSSLFQKLQPAELQKQLLQSSEGELASICREAFETLKQWVNKCQQNTESSYRDLLAFCCELFTDSRGEPKQILDQRYLEHLEKAIISHGPWYVRTSMGILGGTKTMVKKLTSFLPAYWWLSTLRTFEDEISRQFGETRFSDPELLAEQCTRQRWVPASWNMTELTCIWKAILKAFSKFRLEIDHDELNEMAKDFWRSLSTKQKLGIAIKSTAAIFGATVCLAGLLTAAVDAGATLLSTFSLARWLAPLIPSKVVLTIATAGAVGAFAIFYRGIITTNSLQALAAFFALSCDAFGLPRQISGIERKVTFRGDKKKEFKLPNVQVPNLDHSWPIPYTGLWKWTEAGQQWRELAENQDEVRT